MRKNLMTIHPGEKFALLGASGSGKTTLIRLLTGELDGYAGEICYDGIALANTDSEAVCNIAAVIHQDVFLFDDTIRIAITRALIRNTPFLILDEETSALDNQTAEEIEAELMAIPNSAP